MGNNGCLMVLFLLIALVVGGGVVLYDTSHEDYVTKDQLEIRLLEQELGEAREASPEG